MIKNSGRELLEDVMSNFDGIIDKEIEKELRTKFSYSKYPAWNFCGSVWFENNKFYCEIWQYGSITKVINGDTLEDVMRVACEWYGYK